METAASVSLSSVSDPLLFLRTSHSLRGVDSAFTHLSHLLAYFASLCPRYSTRVRGQDELGTGRVGHNMAELGDEARVDGTQDSQHQQRVLEIPTLDNEEVPVVLDDLATDQRTLEDVTEVLVTERAQLTYWVRIIEELWRLAKWKDAIALLDKGIESECSDAGSHSMVIVALMMSASIL